MKVFNLILFINYLILVDASAKFQFESSKILKILVKDEKDLKSVGFDGNINEDIDRLSKGSIHENLVLNNVTGLWYCKINVSLAKGDKIAYYLTFKFDGFSKRFYDVFEAQNIPEFDYDYTTQSFEDSETLSPPNDSCDLYLKVLEHQENNKTSNSSDYDLGISRNYGNSTYKDTKTLIETFLIENLRIPETVLPIFGVEVKNANFVTFKVDRKWKKILILLAAQEELGDFSDVIKDL